MTFETGYHCLLIHYFAQIQLLLLQLGVINILKEMKIQSRKLSTLFFFLPSSWNKNRFWVKTSFTHGSLCCVSLVFVTFYLWRIIRRCISWIFVEDRAALLSVPEEFRQSCPAWSSSWCSWNGCHHQYSWINSAVETAEIIPVRSYLLTCLLKMEFLASPLETLFYPLISGNH